MKHGGNIHIFNVKDDGYFPEKFKSYIEQINGTLNKFFEDSISIGDAISLWRKINDNHTQFCNHRPIFEMQTVKRFIKCKNDCCSIERQTQKNMSRLLFEH